MSVFAHLHLHTTKSRLDGWGTEEQVVQRAVELGHSAVAVTDHGNVCAHVPFWKAAKAAGVKPIFGCEFYICDDMTERTATQETLGVNAFPHVTVLARTQAGYANLLHLSRKSWQEGFYRYPRIDWDLLARFSDGLTVLTGCVGGYPSRLINERGPEECAKFLELQKERIEHLYVELNPCPGLDKSENSLRHLLVVAHSLRLPCVATADAHFPCAEDYRCQDMLLAIGTGRKVDDPTRTLKLPPNLYACDVKEMYARLGQTTRLTPGDGLDADLREAIRNTTRIADACEVELPRAEPLRFAKLPPDTKSEDYLWSAVVKGMEWRKGMGLVPEGGFDGYLDRCRREYDVLQRKGFTDYILIVSDIIREIKYRGAVVLTRGSAGGCCLLWALGASETDPILHDLSFERFFDDTRDDPPDVDVDFPPKYRQAAVDYVFETYGAENCAQLANFNTFQAKAAVKAVANTLGIPADALAPLSSALAGNDNDVTGQLDRLVEPRAKAVLARWPELRLADRFVGQMQNSGIHACGVIISPTPLDNVIGVMRGKDGQTVASIDKRGAKILGHLKMDLLSVEGLDIAARSLELLRQNADWFARIPLDDPKTLDAAKKLMLAGVFQLDGSAAWRVSRIIGLDTFADIAVAGAGCRPGPSEMMPTYGLHKKHPERLEQYLSTLNPVAAEIVRPTFGVLLYQEQVMRLAREMAGLDWPDVQRLRKEVGDKLGTQPDLEKREAWKAEWREKFVGGCVKQGVDPAEAERWWASVQTHGGYSFNKSHAYTYALLGWWMFYLKAHHTHAFYSAYLELEKDPATRKRLIREFRELGGEVRVLDPVLSKENTSALDGLIVGGFGDLYKIGEVGAEKISAKGPFKGWDDFLSKMTPSVRCRIEATGLHTGELDPQALVALAPWFPVVDLPEPIKALRERKRMRTIATLPVGSSHDFDDPFSQYYGDGHNGETVIVGYVVARDVSLKHVELLVEDETGVVAVKISAKNLTKVGAMFRELKVADLVAVSGWWSGDTLYAKGRAVLQHRPNKTEETYWLHEVADGRWANKPPAVPLDTETAAAVSKIARDDGWSLSATVRVALEVLGCPVNQVTRPTPTDALKVAAWAKGDFSKYPKATFNPSKEEAAWLAKKTRTAGKTYVRHGNGLVMEGLRARFGDRVQKERNNGVGTGGVEPCPSGRIAG